MKRIVSLFLVCLLIVLAAGCVGSGTAPATTTETTTLQVTTAPTTIPTTITKTATTVRTTVLTTVPTTAAPSKPLDETITGTGKAGTESMRFTVQAPGDVLFTWKYGGSGLNTVCVTKTGAYTTVLTGKSIDVSLFSGPAGKNYSGTKTFHIIEAGTYRVSVTGCSDWQMTVSNA